MGVGQNGQISFRKTGKEDCGYMVCGSKIFFVPFVNYEPNIQHTLKIISLLPPIQEKNAHKAKNSE